MMMFIKLISSKKWHNKMNKIESILLCIKMINNCIKVVVNNLGISLIFSNQLIIREKGVVKI